MNGSRTSPKLSLLVFGLAFATGCSSSESSSGNGSSADGGTSTGALSLKLVPVSTAPIYPCANMNCDPQMIFNYQLTLTNTGADLQDLRIAIPAPTDFTYNSATIDGGYLNSAVGALIAYIDWLPAGSAPRVINVSYGSTTNIFSDVATDPHGSVSATIQASVTQYDVELATSPKAKATGYLPLKVGADPLGIYSGALDTNSVYVSASPTSGTYMGQGGIYRIALADNSMTQLATHAMNPGDTLPFCLDGSTIYYATHTTDANNTVLMKMGSDGTGATPIDLPEGTLTVRAIATDATYVFLILETMDHTHFVHRITKANPTGATVSSVPLGTLLKNTISLTSDQVVVARTDAPTSLIKLDKATLKDSKLVDVGYISVERTLTCTDDTCFFEDGAPQQLLQVPLSGGTPFPLAQATLPILFDGNYVYTGVNGMIRVGPDDSPKAQALFNNSTASVQASDNDFIYFTINGSNFMWKIHK